MDEIRIWFYNTRLAFLGKKKKTKPLKMLIMDNVDCSFQKDEIIILAKFIYICTGNSTVSFFFWDTVSTKRQHVIPGYQILIFDNFILITDDFILILCSSNITCDSSFVTFGGFLIFCHIWRFHPHIMKFKITFDSIFVTFGGSLIFSQI